MWRQGLTRFIGLSWNERGLLLEAGYSLALAQLIIWLVPFKRVASLVGRRVSQAPAMELTPLQIQTAQRVGWAVRVMATLTPWDSRCLAQALAAKAMLKGRHLPGILMLGVAKSAREPAKVEAHAWVRAGSDVLTGGPGHERFAVVAIFE